VARRRAILDRRCARRPRKSAVGAEESLRRGRTKESGKARKKEAPQKALAFVAAIREREDEAFKILKDLQARHDENPSNGADIALIYVGLGDHDQAIAWLNKAYDARFKASILLRPLLDPLRSDARFKDLKHRIGLPP
jgi:tetratricopeptide (TPR) repeat protein